MRTTRTRKLTALSVVLCLGLSTPTSSHAILTELIVAGTVAGQVAGLLTTALPQVTALAGSVALVVKSGEEIGNTVRGIFDLIIPGRKKPLPEDKAEAKAAPAKKVPKTQRVSEANADPTARPKSLILPKLHRASRSAREQAVEEIVTADRRPVETETFDRLLAGYRQQQRLQTRMLASAEAGQGVDHEGVLAASQEYEGQVEALVEELRTAGRKGDRAYVEAIAKRSMELSEMDRLAVHPVLESLVGRGRHFETLYQEGIDVGAFESLEPLLDELDVR